MSVGFVGQPAAFRGRRGGAHEMLMQRIAQSPTVAARMQGATLIGEVSGTGNYSYDAASASGDGYLMVGDAFAFLDPVFSSGVLLAMISGEMGAGVAEAWLDSPARGRAAARTMEREIRHAMARLGWLVTRIKPPGAAPLVHEPGEPAAHAGRAGQPAGREPTGAAGTKSCRCWPSRRRSTSPRVCCAPGCSSRRRRRRQARRRKALTGQPWGKLVVREFGAVRCGHRHLPADRAGETVAAAAVPQAAPRAGGARAPSGLPQASDGERRATLMKQA